MTIVNAIYIISCYIDLMLSPEEIAAVTGCPLADVNEVIRKHDEAIDANIIAMSMEQDWANVGCEFDAKVG